MMKKLYLCLLFIGILLLSTKTYSQQLTFNYDQAGNQIKREWVCVNCPLPSTSTTNTPAKVEMKLTATVKRTITASPNPFLENLNVDWETESGISVKNISVFTISGVKIQDVKPSPNQNNVTIPFQRLATGMYILYITFSDQKKESIKVIKR